MSEEDQLRNAESNFEKERPEPAQFIERPGARMLDSGDVVGGVEVRERGERHAWIWSNLTVDAEQP
jgi:hypothetical protein